MHSRAWPLSLECTLHHHHHHDHVICRRICTISFIVAPVSTQGTGTASRSTSLICALTCDTTATAKDPCHQQYTKGTIECTIAPCKRSVSTRLLLDPRNSRSRDQDGRCHHGYDCHRRSYHGSTYHCSTCHCTTCHGTIYQCQRVVQMALYPQHGSSQMHHVQ